MSDVKLSKLRPLDDRIVVEAVDEKETSASGLIIPETVSKEKPQKGKVLYVGPGRTDNNGKRISMDVAVGEIVLFTKYGPVEVKIDGKELLILNQSDILAVME
jgi:chaperonin GroES